MCWVHKNEACLDGNFNWDLFDWGGGSGHDSRQVDFVGEGRWGGYRGRDLSHLLDDNFGLDGRNLGRWDLDTGSRWYLAAFMNSTLLKRGHYSFSL